MHIKLFIYSVIYRIVNQLHVRSVQRKHFLTKKKKKMLTGCNPSKYCLYLSYGLSKVPSIFMYNQRHNQRVSWPGSRWPCLKGITDHCRPQWFLWIFLIPGTHFVMIFVWQNDSLCYLILLCNFHCFVNLHRSIMFRTELHIH